MDTVFESAFVLTAITSFPTPNYSTTVKNHRQGYKIVVYLYMNRKKSQCYKTYETEMNDNAQNSRDRERDR